MAKKVLRISACQADEFEADLRKLRRKKVRSSDNIKHCFSAAAVWKFCKFLDDLPPKNELVFDIAIFFSFQGLLILKKLEQGYSFDELSGFLNKYLKEPISGREFAGFFKKFYLKAYTAPNGQLDRRYPTYRIKRGVLILE